MRGGYETQADVARRIAGFILLLTGLSLMIGLYYVKTRAQTARQSADRLHYEIALEEAAIGVLRAEIAHLEDPARLKLLASNHLGHGSIDTSQMISIDDISVLFPLREDLQQSDQAEEGAP